MDAIKGMVDVDTVIGSPVETSTGGTIIPISRVSFGFAAGGGEYGQGDNGENGGGLPFGGGSGAGVSVNPVGFLVIEGGDVRLLPIDANPLADRLVDAAPDLIDRIGSLVKGDKVEALAGTGSGRSYGGSDYPQGSEGAP